MLLSGLAHMSFELVPTLRTSAHLLLRPRWLTGDERTDDGVRLPARLWTATEVTAAADWWLTVSAGREPENQRHVWFGGGVAFGSVTPMAGADLAIDVLVLQDPVDHRPEIEYVEGGAQLGIDLRDCCYVTVDVSADQAEAAARWWRAAAASIS